jgi:hypothetical protein
VRVSHLAMHIEGHLAELDINPLMVLPSGQGVKAVDGPRRVSRHIVSRGSKVPRYGFGLIMSLLVAVTASPQMTGLDKFTCRSASNRPRPQQHQGQIR